MEEIAMDNLVRRAIILVNLLLCMHSRIWKLWLFIVERIILLFKMRRDSFMHLDLILKDN